MLIQIRHRDQNRSLHTFRTDPIISNKLQRQYAFLLVNLSSQPIRASAQHHRILFDFNSQFTQRTHVARYDRYKYETTQTTSIVLLNLSSWESFHECRVGQKPGAVIENPRNRKLVKYQKSGRIMRSVPLLVVPSQSVAGRVQTCARCRRMWQRPACNRQCDRDSANSRR